MAHKNERNRSPMKPKKKGLRGKHKKPQKVYSFNEADDRLRDIFTNHGFEDIPHDLRHQFVKFYHLLMDVQHKENFTRLLSLRDIGIKHFVDCLLIPRLTELTFPLLDLGTGPGFPGIPLKFCFPNERIILAEGVQRRVEFLKRVRDEMELKELDIVGKNINRHFHLPVKGAITRAVEDIQNTLRNVSSCVQTGGKVYLMKGPKVDPEIKEAEEVWGEYFQLVDDIEYSIPETTNQRRLIVYKKLQSIPMTDDEFEEDFS